MGPCVSRAAAVPYKHFDRLGFARGNSLASVCFQKLYGGGSSPQCPNGRLWRQGGKPRASDARGHGHGGVGNRRQAHYAGFRRFRPQMAFPVAIPRRNTSISLINLMLSASRTFMWSKAQRVALATLHPSTTDRSAAASAGHISPIMAMISIRRRRIWPR